MPQRTADDHLTRGPEKASDFRSRSTREYNSPRLKFRKSQGFDRGNLRFCVELVKLAHQRNLTMTFEYRYVARQIMKYTCGRFRNFKQERKQRTQVERATDGPFKEQDSPVPLLPRVF